jgi:hypothetical protein
LFFSSVEDDAHATCRERAGRELFVPRDTELADDHRIERER